MLGDPRRRRELGEARDGDRIGLRAARRPCGGRRELSEAREGDRIGLCDARRSCREGGSWEMPGEGVSAVTGRYRWRRGRT